MPRLSILKLPCDLYYFSNHYANATGKAVLVKMNDFIRPWRVAELLDCSRGFVYALIRKGELEVVRLGVRGLRVKKKSLQEYLEKSNLNLEEN